MAPAPITLPDSEDVQAMSEHSESSADNQHPSDRVPRIRDASRRNSNAVELTTTSLALSAQRTRIAIVGVGFVGESLLKIFGNAFPCIGYDISQERIRQLRPKLADHINVRLSYDEIDLASATHYLISVPTPLRSDRSVDNDHVAAAVQTVLRYARRGCTIVLESSVAVGTTRQLLGPYKDFIHCGISPERVDPGRTLPKLDQVPKITSGLTHASLKSISDLYSKVFAHVVPVSKPEVAEFTKLFENCYRMVNIAYVNEMSDACRVHGVDPHEMIDAASTKPFGFQPFYPGLGVGGHCIPVNPHYLFSNNKNLPVLERATKQMAHRPWRLAKKFHRHCLIRSHNIHVGSALRLLVVGIGFKPGQSVSACSPGLEFARSLLQTGCLRLAFYDPLVKQSQVDWMEKLDEFCWTPIYVDNNFDGVAICIKQFGVDDGVLDGLRETVVRSYV